MFMDGDCICATFDDFIDLQTSREFDRNSKTDQAWVVVDTLIALATLAYVAGVIIAVLSSAG